VVAGFTRPKNWLSEGLQSGELSIFSAAKLVSLNDGPAFIEGASLLWKRPQKKASAINPRILF